MREDAKNIHGIVAEFESPQELVNAAHAAYKAGYRNMDAYSPFPIEGLAEAIGFHSNRLPWLVLGGGITGALGGYGLAYYTSVISYPINVGGRPFHSWPAFIPVTFETTVLFAAFTAVLGMLALNRLPMPYHPIFNSERFALATADRFFLCLEAIDPKFEHDKAWKFLEGLSPHTLSDVELED